MSFFNQYGQRNTDHRREVKPPTVVESDTWTAASELDFWVRDRGEGWGPSVRGPDGHHVWVKAADLREPKRLELDEIEKELATAQSPSRRDQAISSQALDSFTNKGDHHGRSADIGRSW